MQLTSYKAIISAYGTVFNITDERTILWRPSNRKTGVYDLGRIRGFLWCKGLNAFTCFGDGLVAAYNN